MLRGNALFNLESLQDGALNNNDENDYDSLDDFEPGKDEMEAKNHMRERNNSVNLPLQGLRMHLLWNKSVEPRCFFIQTGLRALLGLVRPFKIWER